MICTGCAGTNSAGEPNDGKPTAPFDVPVVNHVGRYLDSAATPNIQNLGIRTLRAGKVRVNPANGRLYLKLGSAIGAYDLDTFFTSRLTQPMIAVGGIITGANPGGRSPLEKASRIDAFVYPETVNSQWQTPLVDSTERLEDFDTDDRGYVYYQSNVFGWGIHEDDGRFDSTQLPFVVQVPEPMYNSGATLFTMKSGQSYFAYTSDLQNAILYDVTNPATPVEVATRAGIAHWVKAWAKNDAAGHVAVIHGNGVLRVYTYAALIAGGAPLVEHVPVTGRKFNDVAFDEAGNLWVTDQGTGSMLWKLAAGSYGKTAFAIGGSTFRPETLHAAAGHVAVVGTDAIPSRRYDLLLLKVVDGAPQPVETNTWFRRYYHWAPSGFAQPSGYTTANVRPFLFVEGGHTYLFYNGYALADVYELGTELQPPSLGITSISPTNGPPAGGRIVTINGNAFGEDAVVSFGGTPAATTFVSAHKLTAVTPAHASGAVPVSVSSGGQTAMGPLFHYMLAPPPNVAATGTSAFTVSVTWGAVSGSGVVSYEVFRNGVSIGTTSSLGFTDGGRTADTSYVYSVRTHDAGGNVSPQSLRDVATTVQFTDSSIVPGMRIKAVHLSDIRKAVGALRAAAGLAPWTWTESSRVKAIQLNELRTALVEARSGLGMIPATFTEWAELWGTIKAVHMQELMNAVR